MLAELEMQSRTEARKAFVEGAWAGEHPSRLLAMARAAGISGGEADALIARVAQAGEQVEHVGRLPRLRKDVAAAKGRFEKVQARASAEIERLERQVEDAALESQAARDAVNAAEESARRLLGMFDEELMPQAAVPNEVLRLIDRRDAEARSRQADAARVAAHDERSRVRGVVSDIEQHLASMPISNTSVHDEAVLRERLKDAKRQLAIAESNLKKAEADAEAARKAIP